jgi:hypothetical protein
MTSQRRCSVAFWACLCAPNEGRWWKGPRWCAILDEKDRDGASKMFFCRGVVNWRLGGVFSPETPVLPSHAYAGAIGDLCDETQKFRSRSTIPNLWPKQEKKDCRNSAKMLDGIQIDFAHV